MQTKRVFLRGAVAAAGMTVVNRAMAQTAAPTGNTDEAKVGTYTLPDPLKLHDGTPVTSAKVWRDVRRPQIMALFAANQHGRTPTKRLKPRYRIVDQGVDALGGLAKRTQVRISFADGPDTPTIRVLLYTPVTAKGPVPTLLHLEFSPAVLVIDEPGVDEGMAWSAKTKARVPDREAVKVGEFAIKSFVERGYGVAYVYCGDIDPDFQGGGQHGVRALFGAVDEPRAPDAWGSIGGWSWGLSRVLDWLQTRGEIDGAKVALSGVSRLGKAVLWAGAQDERFAMVIPLLSGEGGASLSRRNFGETIADLTHPDRFPYWFAPRYADYAADPSRLPVDGHMLQAMIAPRPLLLITGATDTWSDPRGEFEGAVAASPVYRLLGKSGLEITQFPEPDHPSLGDLAYAMHAGGHISGPADFKIMADFMDLKLRG